MKKAQISAPFQWDWNPGLLCTRQSRTKVCKNLKSFFISFILLLYVRYKDHKKRCEGTLNPQIDVQEPGLGVIHE